MEDSQTSEPLTAARLADAALLRRVQADDLDAFEAFFERYRGLIHRTAYGLTGDVGAAEEILQDTFIRAYRHRASLRTDVSPVPWLHRVALNLCYSRLGRRRLDMEPIGEAASELRDGALEPPEHAEREELRQSIRVGVAALPPKHQSVVVLYYLHGMSLQETSDALGIALGTVKSRLHYALHALRGHLATERPGAGPEPVPGLVAVPVEPARPERKGGR
ncbi:MAG TPA: RNA polymerase sigma factor [Candidatus Limnocylindrales bacterium]|nr:RNA polymerase sigma factor [Candidatus Limnocylindrales bacterium]